MPKFDISCKKCGRSFEYSKSLKTDNNPACIYCDSDKTVILEKVRKTKPPKIIDSGIVITGGRIEDAEYNPGLGQVTKSKRHREELAKRMGMEEIGNDFKTPDRIHEKFDKDLAEKIKRRWDDC